MGYRLSKIYTRTGDNGTTALSDGVRVDKDSQRIKAMGSIDELNSLLGLICSEGIDKNSQATLNEIQHRLFDMGGQLSMPELELLTADSVTWLEQKLDLMNAELEPLADFILPGGSKPAATCHVARTVCRRAECDAVTLSRQENISALIPAYLNRLSDLLFVLARYLNKSSGHPDVLWQHGRKKDQ